MSNAPSLDTVVIVGIAPDPLKVLRSHPGQRVMADFSVTPVYGAPLDCALRRPVVDIPRGIKAFLLQQGVKDPEAECNRFVALCGWDKGVFLKSLQQVVDAPVSELANQKYPVVIVRADYAMIPHPDPRSKAQLDAYLLDLQTIPVELVLGCTPAHILYEVTAPLPDQVMQLIAKYSSRVEFVIPLPTLIEERHRYYEPQLPSPQARLELGEQLKAAGYRVAFDVTPYADDPEQDVFEVLKALKRLDPAWVTVAPIRVPWPQLHYFRKEVGDKGENKALKVHETTAGSVGYMLAVFYAAERVAAEMGWTDRLRMRPDIRFLASASVMRIICPVDSHPSAAPHRAWLAKWAPKPKADAGEEGID